MIAVWILTLVLSLTAGIDNAIAAANRQTTGYSASVKGEKVYIRFYDRVHIYGPFKLYVSANGCPNAGCATCPERTITADCIVPCGQIYQTWPQGGKYCEISFPLSAVGGRAPFYFTAVTCTVSEERYLDEGVVSN